jgi:thiamine biosynthesis lipoprotein
MRPAFSASRRQLLLAGTGGLALLAAGSLVHTRNAAPRGLHVLQGATMASSWSVKLHAPRLDAGGLAEAKTAIEATLEAVVARMSTFDPQSELMRFNRGAAGRPVPVSGDLAQVLAKARAVSAASNGAFDVTIAPVVDAWGFGPAADRRRPAADDLARARSAVGWQALEIDARAGTASRLHPAVSVDLSGIAQGYGADRVAAALDRLGFTDYLVDICGEIRTRGLNAQRQPWRLGIERPDATPRRAHRVVALSGEALATSGDYRIYFEQDGVRYHHEMDPRTAAPARHALASVSVVGTDAAAADAWSTALFVAGPERGYALALANGLPACFIERAATGFVERATPAFEALGSWRA